MSNEQPSTDERVLIGGDYWDIPVRIKLRAYLHFGRRIDGQLRRLTEESSMLGRRWNSRPNARRRPP